MKKLLSLILLALCLACCACGPQTPQDAQPSGALPAEELIGLRVSVNPALTLFFDEEGTVHRVDCENADAEELCRGLVLTQISCREALTLVVERLSQQGYLENNTVELEIIVSAATEGDPAQWEDFALDAWQGALEAHQVGCSFQVTTVQLTPDTDAGEQTVSSPQSSTLNEELFDEVVRDADGNIVKTVVTDADGNVVTTTYSRYPTMEEQHFALPDGNTEQYFYQPDGMLKQTVFTVTADSVTITTDYKNGAESYRLTQGPTGTEEQFFENGVIRREVQRFGASERVMTYAAQGKRESSTETSGNFKRVEQYHPDGWLQLCRTDNGGDWREEIYQADGVLLSWEDEEGRKYIFDDSGRQVECYDIDNFGQRTHIFFLADGRHVCYTHLHNGTVQKVVLNGDHQESCVENYVGAETPTP